MPFPPVPLRACGSNVIEGYTDKTSYFPGDEVGVFLQSNSSLQCGLGFYDISGSLVFSANVPLFPQTIQRIEPWANGFNFTGNAKIRLPPWLASGIYSIENKISFVVKSSIPSDVTIIYPINTINAYNNSGGKSLYGFNSSENKASHIVSFLRPVDSPSELGECHECLKWFPSLSNIKFGYISDLDLTDYESIQQSKIIIIIGHSEYWSRKARKHFDQFVDNGGHAVILSGNTMWWQIHYTATKNAMVCYKSAQQDPEPDITMKTILWTEPTLQYPILPSIGADFVRGGYGLQTNSGWHGFKIYNPGSPLLEGLRLKQGDIISLPSGECDGAPIKGFDANGFPILDNDNLKFEKLELIGFDRGSRGGIETFPTFIVLRKTKTSGIIVNTGTNSWCSASGIGSPNSGQQIKAITTNAIMKLLNGMNVFSN
jgi:hypothetical protein